MKHPPTMDEARERNLVALAGKGIHTFSNGTEHEIWADRNCFECWFYDREEIGQCAFEGFALIGMVSPEMADLFGWTRNEKYPDSWDEPRQCSFFQQRPEKGDDGEDVPLPPPADPNQLVLIADPTEDLSQFPSSLAPAKSAVAVLAGGVPQERHEP